METKWKHKLKLCLGKLNVIPSKFKCVSSHFSKFKIEKNFKLFFFVGNVSHWERVNNLRSTSGFFLLQTLNVFAKDNEPILKTLYVPSNDDEIFFTYISKDNVKIQSVVMNLKHFDPKRFRSVWITSHQFQKYQKQTVSFLKYLANKWRLNKTSKPTSWELFIKQK